MQNSLKDIEAKAYAVWYFFSAMFDFWSLCVPNANDKQLPHRLYEVSTYKIAPWRSRTAMK